MSSRLYLAKLTVWLLLMLGGYGVATAQTLSGVIPGSSTVCGGATVTLNPQFIGAPSSGTVTYRVLNTGGVDVPGSPVIVTAATNPSFVFNDFPLPAVSGATTLTVTGSYANATSSSGPVSATILVNPSPVAPISVSMSAPAICAGGSTTATITSPTGLTITSASGPGFLSFSGVPTEAVSITASALATAGVQTYTLGVSNAFSCSITTTVSLTVESPAVTLAASSTVLNCASGPVTVSAVATGGSSYTYAFTSSDPNIVLSQTGTSSTASLTLPATPSSGTATITVSVSTALGCTTSSTLAIPYDNTVPAGPSVTIAAGSGNLNGVVLNATSSVTGIAGNVCQNSPLSLSVSGCASSTTTSTTVAIPAVVVTGPFGSTVLGASTVSTTLGAGIAVYSIPTATVTDAGTPLVYNVVCTGANGCSSTALASLTVTINPTPTATPTILSSSAGAITAGSTVTICEGTVQSLTVSCPTGTSIAAAGISSTGGATGFGGLPTSTTLGLYGNVYSATNTTAGLSYGGSYTVACYNSSGCVGPLTTYSVVANPAPGNPSVTATAGGSTSLITAGTSTSAAAFTVCQQSTIALSVSGCAPASASGSAANSPIYVSGPNGSTILGGVVATPGAPGITNFTIPASNTGVFAYTIPCVNPTTGCSSTAVASLTVTVLSAPPVPDLIVGATTATNLTGSVPFVPAGTAGSVTACFGGSASPISVTATCVLSTTAPTSGAGSISIVSGGGSASATVASQTANSGGTTYAVFSIVPTTTATTYLFVCNNESGCPSPQSTSLTVTGSAAPTIVSSTAISGSICAGIAKTFTNVCSSGSSLTVLPNSSTLVTASGRGLVINTAQAATMSYTVACVNSNGCSSTATPGSFTVSARPSNASLTALTGNNVSLETIPAAGSGSVTLCQFQSLTVATSCVIATTSTTPGANTLTGSASGGASGSAVGGVIISPVPSTTTAQFLVGTSITGTFVYTFVCQNTAGCSSTAVTTLSVNVLAVPNNATAIAGYIAPVTTLAPAPASVTLTPGTGNAPIYICQGNPISLTVSGCTPGTPAGVVPSGSATAGNVVIVGTQPTSASTNNTFYTINTPATGTFVYGISCQNTNCASGTATTVTVIVSPVPAPPTSVASNKGAITNGTSLTLCQNELLSLTAVCPTGTTAIVNDVEDFGGPELDVNPLVPGQVSSIVTIPTATLGVSRYFVVCQTVPRVTNGTTGCFSEAISFTTTVVSRPGYASLSVNSGAVRLATVTAGAAPASRTATVAVCLNSPLSVTTSCLLSSTSTTDQTSGTVSAGQSGTGLVGTITPTLSSSAYATFTLPTAVAGVTTYTFTCFNSNGCTSPEATTLTVTVNEIPGGPTVMVNQPLASGNASINATTANASDAVTVCLNTPLSISVTSCSNVAPGAPTVISGNGQSFTFVSSTPGTGSSVVGVAPLSTTALGTTSYTISCFNSSSCASPTNAVLTVNVLARPNSATVAYAGNGITSNTISAAAANLVICQGNPISLTVTGCASDTQGSPSSVTNLVGTTGGPNIIVGGSTNGSATSGAAYYTINTPSTGTFSYTIACQNPATGCPSTTATVINVTVNATPSAPSPVVANATGTIPSLSACQGTGVVSITANCPTSTSLSFVNGGTLGAGRTLTSAPGILTIATTSTGTSAFTLLCSNASSCSSTPVTFTLTVNGAPSNATFVTGGSPASVTAFPGSGQAVIVCQNTPLSLSVTGCASTTGTANAPVVIGTGSGLNIGGITPGASASGLVQAFNLPTATTGTYVVTAVCTNAAGCSSTGITSLTVTVNETPSAPSPVVANATGAIPTLSACQGTGVVSITANCPTSTSLSFVKSGTLTAGRTLTSAPGVLTISTASAGTSAFTLVCSNASSCTSTPVTFTLAVNAAPSNATVTASSGAGNTISDVTPTASQGLTVCSGSPVALTITGCTSVSSTPVQVIGGGSGNPVVIGGIGQAISGSNTFTTTIATVGIASGTYNITLACTNAAGCSSNAITSFSLTIADTPVSPSISGFASTCQSATAGVTGIVACPTGNVYLQFTSIPATETSARSFTASPVSLSTSTWNAVFNNSGTNFGPGVYVANIQCGLNPTCLGPVQTLTINNAVSPQPPTSVETVKNAVCPGQSTTLVAQGCAGGQITWYAIGSPFTTSVGTGSSLVVSPMATTYYYATCKINGCESVGTTQVVVTILPSVSTIPAIAAQPNPTVAGAPVTLSAFGCPAGNTVIFYSDAQGVNEVGRTITSSIVVNPTASTTYFAACSNGVCRGPLTTGVLVSVNNCNFVANVTPSSATICPGGSVVLTSSGGSSYVWSNGAGNVQTITVQAPGVYNVIVTSAAGCTATASATVVAGSAPVVGITGNTNIVQGQTAVLTATGGITYLWSNGATTPTISTQTGGTYSVTVTSAGGCTAVGQTTVTVTPLPAAPTVTPGTNLQACLGQNVLLTAACATGTPRFNRGNASFNQATYSVESPVAGPVSLNVVCVVNGVEGTATPVTVTFNASPNVMIAGDGKICVTSGVVTGATLTASGATSYLWSNGATTPTITVTTPGVISVTGTTAGCTSVQQINTFSAVCGTGQPLAITGASINCSTRQITINTVGGDGTAIDGRILLVTNFQPSAQPLILDAGVFEERKPVQLQVRQSGVMSSIFTFDYSAQCSGGGTVTPPPASTTTATGNTITVCGQPYVLTGAPFAVGATFTCNPGTTPHVINFIPTGGVVDANSVIEFMSIGITPWTQACSETLDLNNFDNNTFTINARQRNTQTGAILATSQIVVTSPCQRKDGAGREATTADALDVTVLGNPTLSDKVEVEVRGAEGQRLQLRMTDGQGASVSEISVENANSVERQTLGLGRSAGMYFLQVITPSKVKTVKVIRQ